MHRLVARVCAVRPRLHGSSARSHYMPVALRGPAKLSNWRPASLTRHFATAQPSAARLLGQHWVASCTKVEVEKILGDDAKVLRSALTALPDSLGLTIVSGPQISRVGDFVVGTVILSESHASIRINLKTSDALVDLFSCGHMDPAIAASVTMRMLRPQKMIQQMFSRGVPALPIPHFEDTVPIARDGDAWLATRTFVESSTSEKVLIGPADQHGIRLNTTTGKVLTEMESPFQHVVVCDCPVLGPTLFIDGWLQSSQVDEHVYHRALVHPAMLAFASNTGPKRVLIAGGGEGATAREVLRHPSVELCLTVDIDRTVTDACRDYMPSFSDGVWSNPRHKLLTGDFFAFIRDEDALAKYGGKWDVIVVDITEEVIAFLDGTSKSEIIDASPDEVLQTLKSILAPGGVFVMQAGEAHTSDLGSCSSYTKLLTNIKRYFPTAVAHLDWVQSFGNLWAFVSSAPPCRELDPSQAHCFDFDMANYGASAWHARRWSPPTENIKWDDCDASLTEANPSSFIAGRSRARWMGHLNHEPSPAVSSQTILLNSVLMRCPPNVDQQLLGSSPDILSSVGLPTEKCDTVSFTFEPQGLTTSRALARDIDQSTSSVSLQSVLHTWPEWNFVTVDLTTACRPPEFTALHPDEHPDTLGSLLSHPDQETALVGRSVGWQPVHEGTVISRACGTITSQDAACIAVLNRRGFGDFMLEVHKVHVDLMVPSAYTAADGGQHYHHILIGSTKLSDNFIAVDGAVHSSSTSIEMTVDPLVLPGIAALSEAGTPLPDARILLIGDITFALSRRLCGLGAKSVTVAGVTPLLESISNEWMTSWNHGMIPSNHSAIKLLNRPLLSGLAAATASSNDLPPANIAEDYDLVIWDSTIPIFGDMGSGTFCDNGGAAAVPQQATDDQLLAAIAQRNCKGRSPVFVCMADPVPVDNHPTPKVDAILRQMPHSTIYTLCSSSALNRFAVTCSHDPPSDHIAFTKSNSAYFDEYLWHRLKFDAKHLRLGFTGRPSG